MPSTSLAVAELKVAYYEADEFEARAIDEPSVKKACQRVSKRSQNVSLPEAMKEQPSTSFTAEEPSVTDEEQDECVATTSDNPTARRECQYENENQQVSLNVPRKSKKTGKKSAGNSPRVNRKINDSHFWRETLASDFNLLDYKRLLKKSQLTGQLTNIIQQSFHQLSCKVSNISMNLNRAMIVYECTKCAYSISHQCVPREITKYLPTTAYNDVMPIEPDSIYMCICQFSMYHCHAQQQRYKKAATKKPANILRLVEHNRSIKLSCPICHLLILVKNKNTAICYDFTSWSSLGGDRKRWFYEKLRIELTSAGCIEPHLNELYNCNKLCCLLFHRCTTASTDQTKPV